MLFCILAIFVGRKQLRAAAKKEEEEDRDAVVSLNNVGYGSQVHFVSCGVMMSMSMNRRTGSFNDDGWDDSWGEDNHVSPQHSVHNQMQHKVLSELLAVDDCTLIDVYSPKEQPSWQGATAV